MVRTDDRLRLRWIDANPDGVWRSELLHILHETNVEVRTDGLVAPTDSALLLLDPKSDDAEINELNKRFKASGRPVAVLRPTAQTRAADLLIIAVDGLLAQLSDGARSDAFDAVLLDLLRMEWTKTPERYSQWLIRALLNAALARLDEVRGEDALYLLEEASCVADVPQELDRTDRETLLSAVYDALKSSDEHIHRLNRVQVWLLSSGE